MVGNIVYRFKTPVKPDETLYVNLVVGYSCLDDCVFCGRPRTLEDFGKPNIYEKKARCSLYLSEAPTLLEIMDAINVGIEPTDKEVALIGLGEPLIQFVRVLDVIKEVNQRYDVKTRVDTNGLVGAMFKDVVSRLERVGLDEIRVSLNAINSADYYRICRPKVSGAFEGLLEFVKACADSSIDTHVSFVVGFPDAPDVSREDMEEFSISLGVEKDHIIFREYVDIHSV
jgi:TatD family-associated radical SAM protein